MSPRPVPAIADEDKTREQLLLELLELRARNAELEQCEMRAGQPGDDLWKNEDMTRLLFEQKLYGLWVNVGGRIAYINEVGARILGASSPAEVIGKSVLDEIIHPDYRDIVRDRIEAMSGGSSAVPLIEEKYIRVDGSVVDVDVWAISFIYKGEPAILVAFKDITGRKRSEEALRESEEKFRQMAENIGEVFFSFTSDWKRTIYVSPAYERVWGRPLDDVYHDPMAWLEGVHPDDRELPLAVVNKYSAGNLSGTDTVEFRVVRPDGTVRWVRARTYPVTDKQGRMYRVTGIAEDITLQKQAGENLARLAAIVTSSDDAIIGKTLDGFITSWNRGAEKLYGYSEAEAKGKFIGIIVPPERRQELKDILMRIRHGGRVEHVETQRVTKDGRIIDVSISISPIIDKSGKTIGASTIARDITGQKRAEEALRLTSFSLDKARDIIIWFYPDGRIYYANDSACENFGYSRDEMLARTIFDLNPDYTRESWDDRWRELRNKGSSHYEVVNRAKNGRRFPIDVTNTYIRYGEREFMFGYARDITERKRAEEALLESERRFRGIYEQAPLGIAVIDSVTGRFLQINQKYCDIMGYSRDEMLARDFQSITHPDDLQRDLDNMAQLLHGEVSSFHMEKRYIHANGATIWVGLTVVPLWDEYAKDRHHIAMVEDVTERKKAEEALKYAEEFNRSTLDSLPMNIAVLDEAGTIEFVNRSWIDFGRDNNVFPVESIGTGINYIDVCRRANGEYSDEAPAAVEGILSVLNGQQDMFEMEYPCHSPDKKRWFTMRVSRIQANAFRGIIVIHTDITMRKLFEEALAEQKTRAELYLDLMGHDINNMHQIALGYLELARDMNPSASQGEFLDKSIEVLQRGAQLIQNVRKLQKLREGVFRTQEIDVCTLLEEVRREFGAVPNKSITLNTHGREHCLVRANELLHDVFANLVGNAIKHTGDHADIAINMDVREENGIGYCRVVVEDNGPGIPDDFKGKIFNRMLKGTTKAKGMGLGLYLVKSLMDSYGGQMWVEDRVKGDHTQGARFVVLLPAIEK